MNTICTTVVVAQILEFLPWLDDLFKLFYLNRTWRSTILDVIRNTDFLKGKTIMRLKNKKYIILILKHMNNCDNVEEESGECFCYIGPDTYRLRPFSNVMELIIGSCDLNPLFFNYIQHVFPRLIYFKLLLRSPVCIPLLKNFCFNSKHLRYIIICFVSRKLTKEYREKLKRRMTNFFLHWKVNVKLITE
ncbi:conserved Plasmodium protein, unknown function [Plasmodium ovale]|uniref:F-box domain-containing protein n=1 Tax=Plasmodium ovale TaxID=36330 RepID=A0A1C3KQZ7_PLAOA|nr:conserved Plasmodium protein, unknown function [Plasmodium ovale]